jgi:hypothetical protein
LSKAFSSESCPGLDPGWIPVRVKKTRQKKGFARGGPARFPCKIRPCPISGAGVFGPIAGRAAWSAAIAQLVEHVIRNDGVTGSNPVCGTSDLRPIIQIIPFQRGLIAVVTDERNAMRWTWWFARRLCERCAPVGATRFAIARYALYQSLKIFLAK